MPLGLIGNFPGLELGTRLEELHRLGTHFDNGRSVLTSLFDFKRQESCLTELFTHRAHTDIALHPDSDLVAFVFGPSQLVGVPPLLKSLLLVVEPDRSEALIKTWKETLEACDFVGIFALAAVAFVIFLTADALAQGSSGLPLEEIIKALNERLADRRDKKPVGPPLLSPAWAKLHRPGKLEEPGSRKTKFKLPPPAPRLVSSPLSKEKEKHQLWKGDGSINPLWIPLPPATNMEWKFLEGYTSNVTVDDQAKQEVALEVQAGPPDVSPDVDPSQPVVPPPLHPLASSPTTLETTPEVLDNPDSVPIDEKTEKEDFSALNPSAPNSSGIVPSAQVSGPMPDAGSLGAP
ncbi:hypothetical protein FRC05_008932, partial [Tulasnella sp. 425]